MIPRLNASGRAPQYSDVDLMLRGRPRIIMLDGGIPPATPLPTNTAGRRLCVTALRQFCRAS